MLDRVCQPHTASRYLYIYQAQAVALHIFEMEVNIITGNGKHCIHNNFDFHYHHHLRITWLCRIINILIGTSADHLHPYYSMSAPTTVYKDDIVMLFTLNMWHSKWIYDWMSVSIQLVCKNDVSWLCVCSVALLSLIINENRIWLKNMCVTNTHISTLTIDIHNQHYFTTRFNTSRSWNIIHQAKQFWEDQLGYLAPTGQNHRHYLLVSRIVHRYLASFWLRMYTSWNYVHVRYMADRILHKMDTGIMVKMLLLLKLNVE